VLVGGDASIAAWRAALSIGASILAVMTHSDGIDAFLGKELTLCSMSTVHLDANKDLAPRCWITGYCHRRETSVAEALSSTAIISPDEISARILAWDVCFGILPKGSVVGTAWSIGEKFWNSSSIGAILTTWQVVITDIEDTLQISSNLASGMSAGESLITFNQSSASLDRGHRLLLFGDPRVCCPATKCRLNVVSRNNPLGTGTTRMEKDLMPAMEDLLFLRLCMTCAYNRQDNSDLMITLAHHAHMGVQQYEPEAWKKIPNMNMLHQLAENMRINTIQYVYERGKMVDSWIPYTQKLSGVLKSRCRLCGNQTDEIMADITLPNVEKRRLSICPVCGVIADTPWSFDLRFELVEDAIIKVHGSLPSNWLTGAIICKSSSLRDGLIIDWPADSSGKPCLEIKLTNPLPIGPVRMSLVFSGALSLQYSLGWSGRNHKCIDCVSY
jgi:hypothetical protein